MRMMIINLEKSLKSGLEILIHLAMAKITSLIFDDTNNNNDNVTKISIIGV